MRRWPAPVLLGCLLSLALVFSYGGIRPGAVARTDMTVVKTAKLPTVLYTATPFYDSLAALAGRERFPQGAQLMILRGDYAEPLLPDFAASADASVSFDGTEVLFAGKRRKGDPWQIWRTALKGGEPQRVIASSEDAIRPLWMPGGRLLYAIRERHGFALQTASLDGSDRLALSYTPGNYVPDDVLHDGRILFESGFPLGAGSLPEMFLVYPDGSGVESVRCDHGSAREHGREMQSGDIVFTQRGAMARFTSALADETAVHAPPGEYAGDVAELHNGHWLLAVKRRGEQHFALALWQPGSSTLSEVVRDPRRDLVEPSLAEARPIPNHHPSALHPWSTANLLALNARITRGGILPSVPATVEVEEVGVGGVAEVVGRAPVENDGSFFVQVRGNGPVRFVLLDAAGRRVRSEHGWFWARGGEQRVCVGCHAGPERAPDNKLPQVLLRSTTPVDATGKNLQKVEAAR